MMDMKTSAMRSHDSDAQRQGIAQRLWAQAELKAHECVFHPFVAGLAAGTLPRDDFQSFLLQDAYYLHAFAKAFAFAVIKCGTTAHSLAIIKLMSGIEQELRTHTAYLESFGVDTFMIAEATVAPATRAYVDFLLSTAKQEDSVAKILAAMTPCVRLYTFLGAQIDAAVRALQPLAELSANAPPHPYQKWIDAYHPSEVQVVAKESEQLLNDVAAVEKVSYEQLLPFYNQAMQLELCFFEEHLPLARAHAMTTTTTAMPSTRLSFPFMIHADIAATTTIPASNKAMWKVLASEAGLDDLEISDLAAIMAMDAGKYQVTIDANESAHSSARYRIHVVPTQDSGENGNDLVQLPLLATLIAREGGSPPTSPSPSPSSSCAVTTSQSELVVFLKSLLARGNFPWFAAPTVATVRPIPPRVLTIAGSDSGGGAGIQADVKTCTSLGVFATTALTAVTAQDTKGVHAIHAVPSSMIAHQITRVLDDIGTDVVKTGMLANAETIEVVAALLAKRDGLCIVVDPVMVSTSGHRLLEREAQESLVEHLLPLATMITPNIPEASVLLQDRVITTLADMQQAARDLAALGPKFVLVKGGHLRPDLQPAALAAKVMDVFYDATKDKLVVLENARLDTRNTHGTGCTLAAAIAAEWAKRGDMLLAVQSAVAYLHVLLRDSQELTIGKGDAGPMHHTA